MSKRTNGNAEAPLDDPFNPEVLRLSQDFGADLGVEKVLLRVPVRKPHRQEFFQVHPDPEYRVDTALIELADEREWYLVTPGVRSAMFDEIKPIRLFTTINRSGTVTLWPCRLPGPDGRGNNWHESAMEIAEEAQKHWVRMVADRSLGAYQMYRAAGDLDPPTWPDKTFSELLRIAFGNGRLIDNEDHPVIQRLLGNL